MFRLGTRSVIALAPAFDHALVKNRILMLLARSEYRRLQPDFKQVALLAGQVLYAPGDTVRFIYFPNNAVVSLLFEVDGHQRLEVAMEGNEGAVGFAIRLGGVRSRNMSVVRDAGTATRIEVAALVRCANHGGRLQSLLDRYVHALVIHIAQLSVCNRFHSIDERLARWLMMTRDRVGSDKFLATQASIAQNLGARRSGVTTAAGGFHKQNMIEYTRGHIEILDKPGLADTACPCYEIIKHQYDSFLN